MSRTVGQVHRAKGGLRVAHNGRTIAIAIGALVLCSAIALGGRALLKRSPHSHTTVEPRPEQERSLPSASNQAESAEPAPTPLPAEPAVVEDRPQPQDIARAEKDQGAVREPGPAKREAHRRWPDEDEIQRANQAYQRGNTKIFQGNAVDAIADFNQALKLNPMDPSIHRGLGLAYAQAGMPAEAIKHLKQYLRDSPKANDRAVIQKRIQALE